MSAQNRLRPQRASRALVLVLASSLVTVMAACAETTTSIEQSWSAPGRASFERVVALYDDSGTSGSTTVRRTAEDKLVLQLRAQGVQAFSAHATLSDPEIKDLETTKARLRDSGYDGLIVMRPISTEQRVEYYPGYNGYWGGGYWGDPWYGGYWGGYYDTTTIVRVETTAYSLPNNKLVWSTLSATVDADNTRVLIDQVTRVAANELTKRGVVVATREPRPSQEARL